MIYFRIMYQMGQKRNPSTPPRMRFLESYANPFKIQGDVNKFKHHPQHGSCIVWEEVSAQSEELDHGVSVFTDGSKTDSGVGFDVAIFEDGALGVDLPYILPTYATVFQAELTAIAKVLEFCSSLDKSFSLYTDSTSSLMVLSNPALRIHLWQTYRS